LNTIEDVGEDAWSEFHTEGLLCSEDWISHCET
jgi:hypothetical protein